MATLKPAYFDIAYPERRSVSVEQLISWAKDDIANGASDLFESPDHVTTAQDAIRVLGDSGSVTLAAF